MGHETTEDGPLYRLGVADTTLLMASLVVTGAIGIYFSNKNNTLQAYLLGERQLSLVPVAVSLMTSIMSGLTLLGGSAETFYQGPSYTFVTITQFAVGPIIAFTILPVFYRMNEISFYKYLELRFGKLVRYLVTSVFMVNMIFHNAVVLYMPSMALHSVLGVTRFYSILLLGALCVYYSAVGGVKAVVWTDFIQAFMMYISLGTVAVLGVMDAGGLVSLYETAAASDRLNLNESFWSLNMYTRHTLFNLFVGALLHHIYFLGANQVQMQRICALPSLKEAKVSIIFAGILMGLVTFLSCFLGWVIYEAYRYCDPYLAGEIPRRDAILVHYVEHRLREIPGMLGVFVAGIFAATLSTLSSLANSMAALALEDYARPVWRLFAGQDLSDRAATRCAKIFTVVIGVLCIATAYLMEKASSRLLQASYMVINAFGVPFLVTYFLGIFTRFVNNTGILVGLIVSLSTGAYTLLLQVFYAPDLEPTTLVLFEPKLCPSVLNLTAGAKDSLTYPDGFSSGGLLAPPLPEFALEHISYQYFPIVQAVIMFVVSCVVSLVTCGWSQEVDDGLLAGILHRRRRSRLAEPSKLVIGAPLSNQQLPNYFNRVLQQPNGGDFGNQDSVTSVNDSVQQHRRRLATVDSPLTRDFPMETSFSNNRSEI